MPVEEPFAASIADMTGTASIVERRRKLQGLALRGVVIDPEFGVLLRHNVRDALHRSRGLVLVGVDRRHAAIVPVALKVHNVAGKHDRAGLRQFRQ